MITSNPKSFFAYTKSHKHTNKLPSAISYKNKVAENMSQAADLFAEHFSSVYENHPNKIDLNITNEINNFSVSMDLIAKVISEINVFKTINVFLTNPLLSKSRSHSTFYLIAQSTQ